MDESTTLAPLPDVVRAGSIAISIFGLASFFSALGLFLHITYKVLRWQVTGKSGRRKGTAHVFASGPVKFGPEHDAAKLAGLDSTTDTVSIAPSDRVIPTRYPNQFIVLIANLLIADLHQATAFSLSTAWVARNGITTGTKTCFVQGLFISVGDLASSCFMSAVAIHTFYSIVYKTRPSHKTLYISIFLVWAFVYLISLLPLAGTLNGASAGGFFVRAGAWVSHNHH